MNEPLGESDWKYIRSLHDGMLHTLCERINGRAAGLAASRDGTAHERYLKLYRHIKRADGIIADCFNDWRRSQFVRVLGSSIRGGKGIGVEGIGVESRHSSFAEEAG